MLVFGGDAGGVSGPVPHRGRATWFLCPGGWPGRLIQFYARWRRLRGEREALASGDEVAVAGSLRASQLWLCFARRGALKCTVRLNFNCHTLQRPAARSEILAESQAELKRGWSILPSPIKRHQQPGPGADAVVT